MKSKKGILTFIICLLVLAAVSFAVVFVTESAQKTLFPHDYSEYVEKYASEYDVDSIFVYSVIWVESTYRKNAVSPSGAKGLMQIMDSTLEDINIMLGTSYTPNDMFTPEINIRCGVRYIKYLYDRFNGDYDIIAAAYNAGPTAVSGWLNNKEYSCDGKLTNIPYKETRRYVTKINSCYKKYSQLYS